MEIDKRMFLDGVLQVDLAPGKFHLLYHLTLSGNAITSWGDIDHIGGLPALKVLRLTANPLTKGIGAREARSQVLISHSCVECVCV